MVKSVAVSGGFDPLHVGHLDLFRQARKLGDKLIVIVNSDDFLFKKKGMVFMPLEERIEILEHIDYVDKVVACVDDDMTVRKTLAKVKPDIFANGGDRHNKEIPEAKVCRENNIELRDGLGEKIQSSSKLIKDARE